MIGFSLPCSSGDDVARVVRALGSHRYVVGRLLEVHAAAFDAASATSLGEHEGPLSDAIRWAHETLRNPAIDSGSRDPALLRASSEKEVAALLSVIWGPERKRAAARLVSFLARHDISESVGSRPFDEASEGDMFPVLVDAGWELLPLDELDPERHRGAIESFGEGIAYASARFEESARVPRQATLHELSAMGPVEFLYGVDDSGSLVEPLVLWSEGNATYLDYVLRGVLRAARLE